MLIRYDIQLQSHLIKSKQNAISDALSRGLMEEYEKALDEWKARGCTLDTYANPPAESVDMVPSAPPPDA